MQQSSTTFALQNNSQTIIKPNNNIINLENCDYTNHRSYINSPRSKTLMNENGISMEDLYFYNFYQFRDLHPELIPLSLDLQKSHFYFQQDIRQETLTKLIMARRELIRKEEKARYDFYLEQQEEQEQQNKTNQEQTYMKFNDGKYDQIKTQNQRELDKCKERQKKELLNMLDNQLRTAFLQQQRELKDKLEKDIQYEKERQLLNLKREQERLKQFKDKQRKIEEEQQAKEQKRIYAEYFEKERQNRIKKEEKEKQHLLEMKEKERQRLQKEFAFKERTRINEQLRIERILNREEEMKQKDLSRKAMLDLKRKEEFALKEKSKAEHDKLFRETQLRAQNALEQRKEEILQKQQRVEFNRLKKEEETKKQNEIKEEQKKRKEERHREIREQGEKKMQDKIDELNRKEQKKKEDEEIKKVEKKILNEEIENKKKERETRLETNQARNEYLKNKKTNELLTKINDNDVRHNLNLANLREQRDKLKTEKELSNVLKHKQIEHLKQRQAYDIEELNYQLGMKHDQIKQNQKALQDKKDEASKKQKNIEKQKEQLLQLFERLKSKNKKINIDDIKKLFPKEDLSKLEERLNIIKQENDKENEKLNKKHENALLYMKMKHAQHALQIVEQQNKALNIEAQVKEKLQQGALRRPHTTHHQRKRGKTPTTNRTQVKKEDNTLPEHPHINDDEEITNEKAQKLTDIYKHQLMLGFTNFCIKEKEKDRERDNILNKVVDDVTKKRLAKIQAMQRAQSADKKGEYNKLIDVKLQEYQDELKKHVKKP